MSHAAVTDRIDAIVDVFEADDGELWRVLQRIADAPHRALVARAPLVPIGEATGIDPQLLGQSIMEPGAIAMTRRSLHFVARGKRWRFLVVRDARSELIEDTIPNRFTAFFLRSLLQEVRRGLRILERAGDALAEHVEDARWLRRRLQSALDGCDAVRLASPLIEVPHNDLSLHHDPRYRKVMLAYVELLG